jgi:hypothetical protein
MRWKTSTKNAIKPWRKLLKKKLEEGRFPLFVVKQINIVKMGKILKVIYELNVVPIIMTIISLHRYKQINPTIHMEM